MREFGRMGGTGIREEGLNERGEAPPPYTRTAQGSLGAHAGVEGLPLHGACERYVLPRLPGRALTPRGIVVTHGEERRNI